MPNLLLQMLLRSANAVGYANYPDNVVRYFVAQAAAGGIDVFRVFDCLNWVDEHEGGHRGGAGGGSAVRGGHLLHRQPLDPRETKYALEYYLGIARELKAMGTHVLGIKDMGGLVPAARRRDARQGAEGGVGTADPFPHA